MWPFKPRHLRYSSVFAWTEAEKINGPIADAKLQNRFNDQLGELRRHLFNKHLATLSVAEQEQLKAGSHPSQSHQKVKDADEFAALLHSELLQHGFDIQVQPGCYHMDRVILSLFPDENVNRIKLAKVVPQLFRGYEIKVFFKK